MHKDSNYWQDLMRKRLSRRGLLRTGALAGAGLAAGGSALGCGSTTETKPTPASGSQPQAGTPVPGRSQSPTPATEQPQSGGVFNSRIASDPPNFDPISNSTYMVEHVVAPVYNNLVVFDPLDPNKVIGDLAEKWEASPDGKVYTFSLVKGVKFHDGKPCTSADVKYSFDIVRNPPQGLTSPRKGVLAVVDGIETPDENTVRFVLKRPSPSLITNLAQGWMVVMPKHILQEKGDMKKDAIGTGPFKLKNYTQGTSIELVRNPDYFVKGRPYLDGIKFFIVPDPGTSFNSFRSGQLHGYGLLTPPEMETLKKEMADKVVVQQEPYLVFDTLNFNSKRKPWDDIRVRQAASLAIDRAEAIKVVVQGLGAVSGFMPVGGPWALSAAELEKIPGYGKDTAANIAASKKLLAEAGFPNGLSTTMLTRKGTDFEPFSVFLKDQFAKVGIDCKLDVQETAVAYDNLNKRAFDLAPWVHGIAVDDPDAIYSEFYTCAAERNYSGVCSKEVDDLFLKQSQTLNVEERKKLVAEMEKLALMTFTKVQLFYQIQSLGFWRTVRDYKVHPSLYNNRRYQDVWLAKK